MQCYVYGLVEIPVPRKISVGMKSTLLALRMVYTVTQTDIEPFQYAHPGNVFIGTAYMHFLIHKTEAV